jgi:Protein of unknown function (DUF3089)
MCVLYKCYSYLLLALVFAGCSPTYTKYISNYKNTGPIAAPEYSNALLWAALPQQKDLADSIPAPLLNDYIKDTTVDVFFVHPTTFTNKEDNRWNADLNDAAINAKTDYGSILYQASVFNEFNVYAPRYRQAHLRSYFVTDTIRALQAFELAYQDVKAAFEYYLQHYNNGKPIIIASHSQGSTHTQRLLKEFFENSPLQQKLVAAYIIGMYIPDTYFTQLSLCNSATSTGCVIGWRSFKEGYYPDYVIKENNSGWVVNPLSWTTDSTLIAHTQNKGAVLKDFNIIKKRVVGARISNGVLWLDKLHISGAFLVRMKNFHVGDINLFYQNIRLNLRQRVAVFKSK